MVAVPGRRRARRADRMTNVEPRAETISERRSARISGRISEPPAGPVLELIGASKRFGQEVALAPLDLRVARGETLVLIGPSGCGKTTVLRLALGLIWPDAGQVRFRGAPHSPAKIGAARRSMGYVVQDGGLFPHLSAAANVGLVARQLGWPRERIDTRTAELADLARFPRAALGRYPLELSGGQRQRVGLMRALMLDPELLLFDEPLAAIDPLVRAELQRDLCRVFSEQRKAVVLVTHDLAEAAFFADRVALMRAGRVVQQGRVEDFVRSPADPFVTEFVAAQPRLVFGETGSP
jgi:osmoprotectant transport system ATP-binding protein